MQLEKVFTTNSRRCFIKTANINSAQTIVMLDCRQTVVRHNAIQVRNKDKYDAMIERDLFEETR